MLKQKKKIIKGKKRQLQITVASNQFCDCNENLMHIFKCLKKDSYQSSHECKYLNFMFVFWI